jgi:hypothetical protein
MRYNELIENDDEDMFGSSERVDRDLRRATFNANIPEMIRRVQQGLLASADRQARSMASTLSLHAKYFEEDELHDLAHELFTHDAPQHLHQAFSIVSEDPSIIEDEDRLSDTLMTNDIFTNIRNDSELWTYVKEMIEEFESYDSEREYACAMEIEGTVGNLIVKLMQEAFASVRALGENSKPGVPQPGPSSGAPKKFGSDAKIQTRQMTANDIISSVPGVPYYNNVVDDWDSKDYSWGVTKKVIEYATYLKDHPESLAQLPPAIVLNGKFEDGAHRVSAIWLLQQRMDPKNPLWKRAKLNVQFVEQGVTEATDDELFSKSRERPVNRFTIYVNNKPLRTMIDLEQAAGAAEDLINQETRRVNVQVVNAVDGEILWSGGTDRMGKWYGAYAAYLEETEDDDDLFSNRPNGKVIAHDLELWLRRRQSGSRRPLSSYSADAITEIIAAFNKSFAAGVQAWDVAPIIADLKYDIREYIGSSQHIDLADHVQELNEAPLADYEPMGDFEKPGPFRGADKKLIPHPTNKLKTAKFFEQTPYDFRLFFSNIPGTGRYSEYGPMEPRVVQEIFGKNAEQILAGHEDAITVVFVGNKGDSKVMLTPWMMAHRIGHAVQAGTRLAGGRGAWREAENHFFRGINQLLKDFYGKSSNNRYDSDANWAMSREYAALFNAIGTQRSSRTGQIKRPYEFLYELFAQYLGTGKIELNPLPKQKDYGRKVFGRSTQSLRMTPGSEEESQYTTEVLARDMEIMFSDVLSELVGKVLVM